MSEPQGAASHPGPQTPRGARTAARLRQAARDAFSELGWQAARVEDIVTRAGVSHGTFYTYYPNKIAVLDDLVRTSQDEIAHLASAAWEADDVKGALERVITGFLEMYERDAAVFRAWLHAAREERHFSDLYVASRALFVDRVAVQVAAVAAVGGGAGSPPARTTASALVAMVEHLAHCWLVLGEPHDRDDVLRALVTIWGATLNALAGFELVEGIGADPPEFIAGR